MATQFDTEFAESFEDIAEHYGETVTYLATGIDSVGAPTYTAIVRRGEVVGSTQGSTPMHVDQGMTLLVAMADVSTIAVGKARFKVATRYGGTVKEYPVKEVLSQVGGVWKLRLI